MVDNKRYSVWIKFVAGTFIACLATVLTPDSSLRSEVRAVPRQKLDVVLMVDASGSMLKTDPHELRYEGAKLLTSFLSEGDRLGIVQFSGDAKIIQELEPVTRATTDQMIARIRGIKTEGAFTDITEGVKVSATMLERSSQPGVQRVVVLLSDGKVEPDPAVGPAFARTLQLVQEMLPDLKAKEIRVFTVALSEQADRGLLGEIAAATEGLTWYTQTAEEMHKSFAELFLALKRPQVVPQTGRGFAIDAEVDEATFYINHAPGAILSLVSPKEETMTAEKHPDHVTWFAGQNFDVITVKEPELGNWGVAGTTTEDGFATVLTNLKLLTDWPLVLRADDEPLVQARLYEETKPVALPEMSGVIKFGFQIVPTDKISKPIVQEPLVDDGSRGDVVAADGIFSSRTGSLEAGAYKLTVVAKGPTFQRSQQIPFTVRPRLITVRVRNPGGAFEKELAHSVESAGPDEQKAPAPEGARNVEVRHEGGEDAEFTVTVSKEAVALKSFKVSLVALSDDRRIVELPLKRASATSRDYLATASALPKAGRYRVKAVLKGSDKKGEQIEAETSVIDLSFKPRGAHSAATVTARGDEANGDSNDGHSGRSQLPIVPLAVVSLINLVGFVLAYRLLKSQRRTAASVGQRYLPPAQLLESIEVLEARVASTTVSPDGPIFKLVESFGAEVQLAAQQGNEGGVESPVSEEPA